MSASYDWNQAEALLGSDPHQVPSDMVELVHDFRDAVLISLNDLEMACLEDTEPGEISRQVHQLRGNLLNFGFNEVARLLQQVSHDLKEMGERVSKIGEARQCFFHTLKELNHRYPSLGL